MTHSDVFVPQPDQHELNRATAYITENMQYPDATRAENLTALRAAPYTLSGPLTLPVHEQTIATPQGHELRLRIIRPEAEIRAVVVDLHGGGWSMGSPVDHDWFNGQLAEQCRIASVSVDYRLAPEHPHPAALEDCHTAAVWTARRAVAEFGTDRLLMHGASAGAHLGAQTLLLLRDDEPEVFARFEAASFAYGLYDAGRTPSHRNATADTPVLPDHWLRDFIDNVFPALTDEERRHPSRSPLYADLATMPPALFTVGSVDPLLDDSLFMAARWRAAGNDAALDVWPDAMHGFSNLALAPRTGRLATQRISTWFNARLDDRS
ncbi:alpha/beta hydrolase [Streptomyces tendae]|uniref:alpha/beta hydrolase n=1 Tax=Streptomyces tendae TaxID=1932 RepID=UPI0036C9F94D